MRPLLLLFLLTVLAHCQNPVVPCLPRLGDFSPAGVTVSAFVIIQLTRVPYSNSVPPLPSPGALVTARNASSLAAFPIFPVQLMAGGQSAQISVTVGRPPHSTSHPTPRADTQPPSTPLLQHPARHSVR